MSPQAPYPASDHPLLIGGRDDWLVPIADHIRAVVALTDKSPRPKPMSHPYLKAGDPSMFALAAVGAIRDGLRDGNMAVTRLALVIGAAAEHSMMVSEHGTHPATMRSPWEAKVRVRVGLSLLNCVLMATGWFSPGPDPHYAAEPGPARVGPRLILWTKDSLAPWLGHRLDRDLPGGPGYRPIFRDLPPPFETIRGPFARGYATLVLTETAEDLPGGDIELARAVPAGWA